MLMTKAMIEINTIKEEAKKMLIWPCSEERFGPCLWELLEIM